MRRAWAAVVVIVVGLGVGAPRARQAAAPAVALVDVYRAGEGGYHTFRIPSLIAMRSGTLLAFAEGRRVGAGDAGDIDLVLKRSRDGGRTWSALQVIGDNGPNTFGNPCPVVDRATDTIWLLTTQNRGGDREADIVAGTSRGTRTVWVMKSTNQGEQWSAPVDITASVKRPEWTWYATGPGIGIQTRAGRLVVPANHAEAGTGVHRSHVFYSDDGGRTWSPAAPDQRLVEPPAQASLITLPGGRGDRRRVIFANPASTKRERLTVRLSEDDGATWPGARMLHAGPAAYSSLAAMSDGGIGVLFELGDISPYERIAFARVTVPWLVAGRHQLAERQHFGGHRRLDHSSRRWLTGRRIVPTFR